MKQLIFILFAFCLNVVCANIETNDVVSTAMTDREVWNEGVTAYRAGDVTNALRVLRPLLLSKTHGARAAEVVAKLAHEQAHTPGASEPLKALEESAAAAQIALRAHPGDARAERNFSRAIEGLSDLRETMRIQKILESAKGQSASALLVRAVKDARAIMAESVAFRTNRADVVVARADALATRAEKVADVWYPVKEAICQSVTNEEMAATITVQVDQARAKTEKAAQALGDLSDDAYSHLADAEIDLTRFLKLTIDPPAAMDEDLAAQSNAVTHADMINKRPWQNEALVFTRAFRVQFPAWAKAYEQQAQADTNQPPFTAEDQSKIAGLATRLEQVQMDLCEKERAEEQEKALSLIREIRELLPKQKGGGGQQNNPQQNQQNQNQQQQQKDQSQDQQQEDASDQTAPEQDEQESEGDPNDEQGQDGDEESSDDRELDSVLRKAQERSDEHEAEKRARMRKAPLPPNARDW